MSSYILIFVFKLIPFFEELEKYLKDLESQLKKDVTRSLIFADDHQIETFDELQDYLQNIFDPLYYHIAMMCPTQATIAQILFYITPHITPDKNHLITTPENDKQLLTYHYDSFRNTIKITKTLSCHKMNELGIATTNLYDFNLQALIDFNEQSIVINCEKSI